MINVSDQAAEKFKEIAAEADRPEKQMLRISYGGAGWGGPRWGLALEELEGENDTVLESNGVKIIYLKDLEGYLSGLTLEYSDEWYNKGFSLSGGQSSCC